MNIWKFVSLSRSGKSGWLQKYLIEEREFSTMRRNRDRRIDSIWHLPDPKQALASGTKLKQFRTDKGISIGDLVARTYLSKRYIIAIEEGNFEELPGGLFNRSFVRFNRSFVRLYARAIGYDEEDALRLFYEPPLKEDNKTPLAPSYREAPAAPKADSRLKSQFTPPRFSEYLLYLFLSKSQRINVIGDLCEEYIEVVLKFGEKKAKFWFRKQVFSSLRPLIWRIILKIRMLSWLNDFVSKILR